MGKLVRCITSDGCVVAMAVDATDMAAKAEQYHKTSAVVSAALGRLLAAASMMGNALKEKDGSVTLRVNGDGPIGSLIAVADSQGNVRGCAGNNMVELPLNAKGKLDVGRAVGAGTLYVIKDTGGKEPYVGSVPLISGEIGEDITSYYAVSEQIPTVCGLGVLVNPDLTIRAAGGYLIQLLPTADEEIISMLENAVAKARPVSTMVAEGMTPYDMLKEVLDGFEVELLEEGQASYRCNCSRHRVERALISLSPAELEEMARQEDNIEVQCHFCDKVYSFTPQEIQSLQNKK